jgi:hypothetical protein
LSWKAPLAVFGVKLAVAHPAASVATVKRLVPTNRPDRMQATKMKPSRHQWDDYFRHLPE